MIKQTEKNGFRVNVFFFLIFPMKNDFNVIITLEAKIMSEVIVDDRLLISTPFFLFLILHPDRTSFNALN